MSNSASPKVLASSSFGASLRRGWLPAAAALAMSGCVVSEPSTLTATPIGPTGAVVLAWTVDGQPAASGCAAVGLTKVDVLVLNSAKTQVLAKGSAACSAGQVTVSAVPTVAGGWLQVDGYAANDPAGSPSWGNSPLTGPHTITANQTVQVAAPVNLVKLSAVVQPSGKGNVYVTWTVKGEQPGTGCTQRAITSVTVRILDEARAEIASQQAPCSAGNATVANVPAGSRYVQIDAVGPAAPAAWGNINLAGPLKVENAKVTSGAKPIDLDLRSVISMDWAMANGGTCAGNGVGMVYVEARNAANQLIVPMNDPWAAKPCTLGSADSYDARVIDMGFAKPQCAIPPGAKGLVLCNVPAGGAGVFLTATASGSSLPKLGGSVQVKGFEPGSHIALLTPVLLSACSGANPCVQP